MQCSKHDILYVMQLELFSKEMHVECWNSAGSYKWATLKAESLSTEKYHPKKVHSGNGRKWYKKSMYACICVRGCQKEVCVYIYIKYVVAVISIYPLNKTIINIYILFYSVNI